MLGERGVSLSGGQRQRLVGSAFFLFFDLVISLTSIRRIASSLQSLARAVYADADLVLLDDTFSALDGETEAHGELFFLSSPLRLARLSRPFASFSFHLSLRTCWTPQGKGQLRSVVRRVEVELTRLLSPFPLSLL